MPQQGNLSIELARASRASFYRSFHKQGPVEEGLEVRSAIQQIAIEHRRRYGYRRISAELRRRGMRVNHKRVMRIMTEDNLLALQPKSFVVTTNSDHEFEMDAMRRADQMVPANFPTINTNAPINPMPISSRLDGSGVATAGLIVRLLSPPPPRKVPKLAIEPTKPKLASPLQLAPESAVLTPEKPCGFGFGSIVAESMVVQEPKKPVGSTYVSRKFVTVVFVVMIPGTSNDQLKSGLLKVYIASAFASPAEDR
jgi:hypothetical protein